MAIEEPAFDVLVQTADYEIRRYAPYLVAEVDVSEDSADSQGFRTLAGYIFGDNRTSEKMQMTAPVESRDSESQDKKTYAFVMESKYTRETIPEPNNDNIRLRERLARVVAVRKFSGRWSDANVAAQEQQLLKALADDGVKITGGLELARYNSPFTLWFLRRNEVMVPVEWPAANN
jgi:hypothetical protein